MIIRRNYYFITTKNNNELKIAKRQFDVVDYGIFVRHGSLRDNNGDGAGEAKSITRSTTSILTNK
jgi:hypothetical protein